MEPGRARVLALALRSSRSWSNCTPVGSRSRAPTARARRSSSSCRRSKSHFDPDEILSPTGAQSSSPVAPALAVRAGVRDISHSGLELSEHDDTTTVLVVEDNIGVRHFMREQLQSLYRVLEADHGGEGFKIAVSSLPDLVVSDVMMPEMDGYELCQALKADKRTCHIPVVLLTARAGRDDKLMGIKHWRRLVSGEAVRRVRAAGTKSEISSSSGGCCASVSAGRLF